MARVLSIEPLKEWPEPPTPDRAKSPFKATWTATLDLLEAEDVRRAHYLRLTQLRIEARRRARLN